MPELALTADAILKALTKDPRYSDPTVAARSLPFLLHLPQIMGSRIHHLVSLQEFVEIQDDFLRFMLLQDAGNSPLNLSPDGAEFCVELVETIDELPPDIDDKLDQAGVSPEELIIPGMNDELKGYYDRGVLTFGIMFGLQPWLFIPEDTQLQQA